MLSSDTPRDLLGELVDIADGLMLGNERGFNYIREDTSKLVSTEGEFVYIHGLWKETSAGT